LVAPIGDCADMHVALATHHAVGEPSRDLSSSCIGLRNLDLGYGPAERTATYNIMLDRQPHRLLVESGSRPLKVERVAPQNWALAEGRNCARSQATQSAVFTRNSECWHVAELYPQQSG
jgi:hypothetical protein